MPDRSGASTRFVALLWFLASGLADIAVVVRYLRTERISWPLIAAGAFFLVMGVMALQRSRGTADR